MATQAITLQLETPLSLISQRSGLGQEEALMFTGMCTSALCFSPTDCLRPSSCLSTFSWPRVSNLFSLFSSPTSQLIWSTIAKNKERRLGIFYMGFFILGRFVNSASIIQKLKVLKMGEHLGFVLTSLTPKTSCAMLSFTFHIKFKTFEMSKYLL